VRAPKPERQAERGRNSCQGQRESRGRAVQQALPTVRGRRAEGRLLHPRPQHGEKGGDRRHRGIHGRGRDTPEEVGGKIRQAARRLPLRGGDLQQGHTLRP